jgi:cell division transport system permease protein
VRANFVVSGVATGVRRNMTMTIALVLSTAIALAAVGATYLLSTEISRFKHDYEGRLNASIFLCASSSSAPCKHKTTPAETAAISEQLAKDPAVKSFKYVTEAENVHSYRATSTPEAAKLISVGDLPASFTVQLVDIKKDFDTFVSTYRQLPGVSGTTNASTALKTLLKVIDGGRLFSIVVAITVLIASILLIANSIQVAAAQRKNETSIMRLVGASRWMTELPFMLETIVSTFVGGLIALGMIALGKQFVLNGIFKSPVENGVIPNLSTNDVLVAGGIGILAGIVLSAITAFATLRLYVRL